MCVYYFHKLAIKSGLVYRHDQDLETLHSIDLDTRNLGLDIARLDAFVVNGNKPAIVK